jgi:isochorismate pyruvate lyase
MAKMKQPKDCHSISEIREQIDYIDQQLIDLFAQRFAYVKEIVKYKEKSEEAIVAQERKDLVISQRASWAEQKGLDKETYRFIFNYLVEHNISKEMETLNEIEINK